MPEGNVRSTKATLDQQHDRQTYGQTATSQTSERENLTQWPVSQVLGTACARLRLRMLPTSHIVRQPLPLCQQDMNPD
jgi:hypothetical protein